MGQNISNLICLHLLFLVSCFLFALALLTWPQLGQSSSHIPIHCFLTRNIFNCSTLRPEPPMKPNFERLAGKHWIFPVNPNREKRQYQYDIAETCLLDNTLVAIPTGTGKTFIAGVVMLNYYRWFPKGKIIFLAPTKPLVAQQITACHEACGIPGTDAAELNGDIPPSKRAELWDTKRVFYMTPQTLQNDIVNENFHVEDLVLLVLDEAHRATGDYAYCTVIRHFMAKNPHFRVLALTATPSGDKDKLQAIVDNLHLSHIEIRSEASPDVKEYIKDKTLSQHVLKITPELGSLRDKLAKVMNIELSKVKHVFNKVIDPVTAKPYTFKSTMDRLQANRHQGGNGHQRSSSNTYFGLLNLNKLSQVMGYLMDHSLRLAYEELQSIETGTVDSGKKSKSGSGQSAGPKKPPFYTQSPAWKELMAAFRKTYIDAPLVHPKMEKLGLLLLEYFTEAEEKPELKNSKAMVFASFRNVVEEIVEYLANHQPLIRPVKFVGQSGDAKGRKGLSQKEQLQVIERFKKNHFNVLVSTSVGEEGLDIGEVDLIICYETPQGAIRNLQRAGRTGRKRDGRLDLLLTEGREDDNWNKSHKNYEDVQYAIRSAKLELYKDVKRMLPDDMSPTCKEQQMDITPYERITASARRGRDDDDDDQPAPSRTSKPADPFFGESDDQAKPKRTTKKRKRDDDPARNIPAGALGGFMSAADIVQGNNKRRKPCGGAESDGKQRDHAKSEEGLTLSQLMEQLNGVDEYAAEVEHDAASGPSTASKGKAKAKVRSKAASKKAPVSKRKATPKFESPLEVMPVNDSIINLMGSSPIVVTTHSADAGVHKASSGSWLLSDDELDQEPGGQAHPSSSRYSIVDKFNSTSSATIDRQDHSSHLLSPAGFQSARVVHRTLPSVGFDSDSDAEINASTPAHVGRLSKGAKCMPPPDAPIRAATPELSFDSPEAFSQAVRAPGGRRRQKVVNASVEVNRASSASPNIQSSPIRTQQYRESSSTSPSPPPQPRKRGHIRADPVRRAERNPLLDTVAAHSGDENSENAGDTSASDEEESESDRLFVTEVAATQADPEYDQAAAYRAGLLTHMANNARGPHFKGGAVRSNWHLNAREHDIMRANKRAAGVSSSPVAANRTLSDYEMDSFVVGDEESIMYSSSP
ncbi:P-loop containing nucleoside triphosphate hydrolase protein [Auriculariales sp. MPI-PUGE-AT-0066]|nr:P-loop containing nucleoside triphosphate hydrolase protein [Auriculariales sp. MPI-PUGE-AT-0066]